MRHRRDDQFAITAPQAVLLALVALGAALRFTALGTQSFWYDEYNGTLSHVTLGFGGMLHDVAHGLEREAPLYFVLAWAWKQLFGAGEVGLRSLSALIGTATIPIAYLVVRELTSRRAGLIAAALVAVNPLLIWYSQEARAYALLVLLSALSFLFFVRALGDRRGPVLAGWATFTALAMATHYFAWLLAGVESAWLLAVAVGERRRIVVAICPLAATAAALVPLFFTQQGGIDWVVGIPLARRLGQIPVHWVTGYSDPSAWLLVSALAAVGAAVVLLAWRGDSGERRAARIAAGVGLGGIGLALVAGLLGFDYWLSRYLLPFWMPLAAVVAIGFGARSSGRLGLLLTAGLCVLSVGLTFRIRADDRLQRPDWRGLASALGPVRDRRMIVTPGIRQSRPLVLYLGHDRYVTQRGHTVGTELDVVYLSDAVAVPATVCWWGAPCVLPRADRAPVSVPRGFRLVRSWPAGLFTVRRYRAAQPRSVATRRLGADLSLYAQRPG